jgi:hypothetical protein
MTDWCYHDTYDEPTRDALDVALTALAKQQVTHCLEQAASHKNPAHDFAAHLSVRHTGLSHKGLDETAPIYLLTFVATGPGVVAPDQILFYAGPCDWIHEKATKIESELEQRALDNSPVELNSIKRLRVPPPNTEAETP